MPLNIDLKPIFRRDANFSVPKGDGFETQSCRVTFNALAISALEGFDLSTPKGTEAFLRRVVVELDGLIDAAGNRVDFTPEFFAALLDIDWARQGLVTAYLLGRQKAAEGN